MSETHTAALLPLSFPSPCPPTFRGLVGLTLFPSLGIYFIYRCPASLNRIFSSVFLFLHPQSRSQNFTGFPVSLIPRAGLESRARPRLMIRCTTHMKPGFGRKSMEKEVLSAACFLVNMVEHSRWTLSLQKSACTHPACTQLCGSGLTLMHIPLLYFTDCSWCCCFWA